MASGQKKKRLNGLSGTSCDLQEQCDMKKKKKLDLSRNLLNMKAHISLEWDGNQQMVVAKREQIGIAWRELGPFINPPSPCPNDLADVFSVPEEIFGLNDLIEVLSYEVWKTCLSEAERNLLCKFLPEGPDAEQVVQALLKGENHHFGSPFLKWGASLCSGNFHPDAVLCREQYLKANTEAYRSELLKYHNDMVGMTQKWKEIWESSDDPEGDIVEKMRRNGLMDKRRSSSTNSERSKVARSSRKEEKPHKLYIRFGDGAKYMSYFKITKKQHQLVKGMKQSGSGIKSTSLNHVLGDIKSFTVQPYEVLEEEERKKLHDHWLQLANKDLPSAFLNWKERQSRRQQWRSSLEQELAEKMDILDEDEVKGNLVNSLAEESNGETHEDATVDEQNCEIDEESAPSSMNSCRLQRIPSLNGQLELEPMDEELEGSQDSYKEHASPDLSTIIEDGNSTEDFPVVAEQNVLTHSGKGSGLHHGNSQSLQRIPSLNHHHEFNAMNMELREGSHDILKLKPNGSMPFPSDFAGTMSSTRDAVQGEIAGPSAKDAWPEVGLLESGYHHVPATHGYTSPNELSLGQSHIFKQQNHSFGLETDLLNQDVKGILLHKPSNNMGSGFHVESDTPFFGSYPNQDRNVLLQQFLQQGMVPSHSHDQKQAGLQLHGASNGLLEDGQHQSRQHADHLQEQKLLLMQKLQMAERENYMRQVAHTNMYPGGRYSNPSQELFLPVNMQNWDFDHDHVSAPLQGHSIGRDFFVQNTFPMEHQARGGWSAMDVSSSSGQCLGNASNADGNLYSVVSPFELQSHSSYSSIGSSELHASPSNFVGRGITANRDFYPHTGQQLNYLECEAAAPSSLKVNNISWMNLPHQNSNLHDSMGKPSLRSWNQ